jgi:REP element-mobilizing transposase RayT
MPSRDHLGWYKHGKLPHFDDAGLYQFITYRLDDSLPKAALAKLEGELRARRLEKTALDIAKRKRIEDLMDAGHGACILRLPDNAELVIDAWHHFDGKRYASIAGVVMPNHVHVLVRVFEGTRLGKMVEAWKTYTSRRFHAPEMSRLPHWQRGYWDRYIRNEAHFADAVRYVLFNPVRAGLVEAPVDWPYLVLGEGVDLEVDPPA